MYTLLILFFSDFNPSLFIKEQLAAVKRLWSNWGFSALLKDTSTYNYGESGDRTGYLVVNGMTTLTLPMSYSRPPK